MSSSRVVFCPVDVRARRCRNLKQTRPFFCETPVFPVFPCFSSWPGSAQSRLELKATDRDLQPKGLPPPSHTNTSSHFPPHPPPPSTAARRYRPTIPALRPAISPYRPPSPASPSTRTATRSGGSRVQVRDRTGHDRPRQAPTGTGTGTGRWYRPPPRCHHRQIPAGQACIGCCHGRCRPNLASSASSPGPAHQPQPAVLRGA